MKNMKRATQLINNTPTYMCKLLTLIIIGFGTTVQAGPVGGVVASGSVGIQSNGPTTTVTQGSQKAIVNWQGFSVAPNEVVNFVQPNSSALILNRVQSPNGSVIQGQITANGKVFLINPNGILFSQGSSVNVGGFVASTLGISDNNFLNGNYKFSGDSQATVTNQGSLNTNTEGGYIALLGSKVVNDGVITAKLGTVAMAAGSAVTLDVSGDRLLNVTVDQGVLDALVRNGHLIQADGGQVIMTAQGAGALMSSAVNNSGVIQAQSIQNQNGVIKLTADASAGVVNLSGTLDVSGTAAGQKGGAVQVTASNVNLNNAKINASGDAGGGQVLIGGNFHGAGPLVNAKTTTLDRGTKIDASAIRNGDGGKIAVWSSGTTFVDATFIARGGSQSGNGGFVETSGHVLLMGPNLNVNTLALNGTTGIWLVDPNNYEICLATCSGALDTTTETPASVIAHLVTSNYEISAVSNITVSDAVSFATASRVLTLRAGNNILINAAMVASGSDSGFTLIAGNNALINASITASNLNSIISVTATNDITTTGVPTALTASGSAAQINLTAHHDITVGTVTAAGGGLLNLIADRNVSVGTATATGAVTIKADATGKGPGAAAGTVSIGTVTSDTSTVIRFNPVSYATTSTEIDSFTVKITGPGTKDVKAWVFAKGVNKEYDTSNSATLAFIGTPTDVGAVTLDPGTASFNSPGAANSVPVTYTSYSISGAASPKLALFSGSGTSSANITAKAVTATATGTNKVYDGTTADTVTVAVTALPGDTLTAASTSANFADKNVGTGKSVSVTGISLGGTSAANYTVNSTAATTANITPASLTINATGNNKAYDGTTTATVGLTDNRVAGDVLTTSYGSANFASTTVGDGKSVNVAGISATGAGASNYVLANTTATTTANITAASGGGGSAVSPGTGTPSVTPGTSTPSVTPGTTTPKVIPADVSPGSTVLVPTDEGVIAIAAAGLIDLANSNYMLSTESGGWGASGMINHEVSGVANQLSEEESGQASALSSDMSGTVRVIGVTGGIASMLAVKPGALPQQMTSLFPVAPTSTVPVGPARARRQNRN